MDTNDMRSTQVPLTYAHPALSEQIKKTLELIILTGKRLIGDRSGCFLPTLPSLILAVVSNENLLCTHIAAFVDHV